MRIYLASRYPRREELCGYRDDLQKVGYTVTSSWLDNDLSHKDNGTTFLTDGEEEIAGWARRDIEDIQDSEVFILFTSPEHGRGGNQVEFGYALAFHELLPTPMRLVIVGERQNTFHYLSSVEVYSTWQEALQKI